jgi:hypothetical protein
VLENYKVGSTTLTTAAAVKTKAEGADSCKSYAAFADINLENPFNLTAPNFQPKTGSVALSGASFFGMPSAFTVTTYVGAVGTTNWATGWTSFTPQTNVY